MLSCSPDCALCSGRSLSVSSSGIPSCILAHIYSHPLMLWLPLCAGAEQRGDSGSDLAGSIQDPANDLRRMPLPRTSVNKDRPGKTSSPAASVMELHGCAHEVPRVASVTTLASKRESTRFASYMSTASPSASTEPRTSAMPSHAAAAHRAERTSRFPTILASRLSTTSSTRCGASKMAFTSWEK